MPVTRIQVTDVTDIRPWMLENFTAFMRRGRVGITDYNEDGALGSHTDMYFVVGNGDGWVDITEDIEEARRLQPKPNSEDYIDD